MTVPPPSPQQENQLNASVRSHLESTRAGFKTELDELKTKTEEDWKTLEAVEKSLMSLINQKDYDVTAVFKEHHAFGRGHAKDSVTSGSSTDSEDRAKVRQNRVEQEEYYLSVSCLLFASLLSACVSLPLIER